MIQKIIDFPHYSVTLVWIASRKLHTSFRVPVLVTLTDLAKYSVTEASRSLSVTAELLVLHQSVSGWEDRLLTL